MFDWLKRLLKRPKKEEALVKAPIAAIVEAKQEVQHASVENVPNVTNVTNVTRATVETHLDMPLQRTLKQELIAKRNLQRRTKFSNAEHFKRRQPTTARKLWRPDAKIEED